MDEELREIWVQDPDLFNFIMFYEDDDIDNYDVDIAIERAYLIGEYD